MIGDWWKGTAVLFCIKKVEKEEKFFLREKGEAAALFCRKKEKKREEVVFFLREGEVAVV